MSNPFDDIKKTREARDGYYRKKSQEREEQEKRTDNLRREAAQTYNELVTSVLTAFKEAAYPQETVVTPYTRPIGRIYPLGAEWQIGEVRKSEGDEYWHPIVTVALEFDVNNKPTGFIFKDTPYYYKKSPIAFMKWLFSDPSVEYKGQQTNDGPIHVSLSKEALIRALKQLYPTSYFNP